MVQSPYKMILSYDEIHDAIANLEEFTTTTKKLHKIRAVVKDAYYLVYSNRTLLYKLNLLTDAEHLDIAFHSTAASHLQTIIRQARGLEITPQELEMRNHASAA